MMELQPVQIAEQQHLRDLLASGLVTDWSLAIDGGAHLGGWTKIMARHFSFVFAIEPSEAFEQLEFETALLANVDVLHAALMQKCGTARCISKLNRALTGRRFAFEAMDGPVRAITLDSLGLASCGLLKLDIEGGELGALRGAKTTVERFRPFILVEMAGKGADWEVAQLLKDWGYRRCFERGVDKGFRYED